MNHSIIKLKLKNNRSGSALLFVLIFIMALIPIAINYSDIAILVSQNIQLTQDSSIAETATKTGVNEVKQKINTSGATFIGNGSCYWVDLATKIITGPSSGADKHIPLASIRRDKEYYEVCRNDNGGDIIYETTGYYAGLKHAYQLSYTTAASRQLKDLGYTSATKETWDAFYYNSTDEIYYNWDTLGKLRVVDVNNPSDLSLSRQANIGNENWRMVQVGQYLYSVDKESNTNINGYLNVVDVDFAQTDTPKMVGTPSLLGTSGNPSAITNSGGLSITADGNTLYVSAVYRTSDTQATEELIVYDIDPGNPSAAPTLIKRIDYVSYTVPVGNFVAQGRRISIFNIGIKKYAYITDKTNGLVIIDVTDHNDPKWLSTTPIPYSTLIDQTAGNLPNGNAAVNEVVVVAGYAYVITKGAGLQIINVQDPANPLLLDNNGLCANAMDEFYGLTLVSSQNRLYVTNIEAISYPSLNSNTGFYIFDISTPGSPKRLAGMTACPVDRYTLSIPASDQRIKTFWPQDLIYDIDDQFFIVRNAYISFSIFRLSDLSQISIAPFLTNGVTDFKYRQADGLVYSIGGYALQAINISDVNKPKVVGNFYLQGVNPGQLPKHSNAHSRIGLHETQPYLYFYPGMKDRWAGYGQRLYVYRINSPMTYNGAFSHISTRDWSVDLGTTVAEMPKDIQVKGNYMYILIDQLNFSGINKPALLVVDISNPSTPNLVRKLELPGAPAVDDATPPYNSSLKMNLDGNTAWVINYKADNLVKINNINNLATIAVDGTSYAINNPTGVAVDTNKIYISQYDKSSTPIPMLKILDKANPANELDNFSLNGGEGSMAVGEYGNDVFFGAYDKGGDGCLKIYFSDKDSLSPKSACSPQLSTYSFSAGARTNSFSIIPGTPPNSPLLITGGYDPTGTMPGGASINLMTIGSSPVGIMKVTKLF